MPQFDAYLMVDWSASSKPNQGADSIWWSLALRDGKCLRRRASQNVRTRAEARRRLGEILTEMTRDGRRTLAGFDFPLAYPTGLAKSLGLSGAPWRSLWADIAARIVDGADNANNRFVVAGDLNRRISDAEFPFWGHHPAHNWANVARTKPKANGQSLAERRHVEHHITGPQPCWKLYGNGSVGSQALLGIPVVHALRQEFPDSRVWPFESGRDAAIVFAEIYPSQFLRQGRDGEIKDRLQVEATSTGFAKHDADGTLTELLAAPEKRHGAARERALTEEGWILGVA